MNNLFVKSFSQINKLILLKESIPTIPKLHFLQTLKPNKYHNGLVVNIKRYSSTAKISESVVESTSKNKIFAKNENEYFTACFSDIVNELVSKVNDYDCKRSAQYFERALYYNVPHGKKNRGLFAVSTYKELNKNKLIKKEDMDLACVMGWCVEMLQSVFLIADDVMDGSITRRGQPCWHTLEDVGFTAINDSLMIENSIYHILNKFFSSKNYYTNVLELFHETIFTTTIGQSLDMINSKENVLKFSMDTYKSIVANKTSFYTFYLPFALAMHMAGFSDKKDLRRAKMILLEIGQFFQIQDDFLDCFGNANVTGKIGTDIQDNKCSWLAVICMQRASDVQKEIMLNCYGQKDAEKVATVKQLYKDLDLPNVYLAYEEESYKIIKKHILNQPNNIPHEIFLNIVDKIYKRVS